MCYVNAKQPLQCILVMCPGRQTRAVRSPWPPISPMAAVWFDMDTFYLRAGFRVNPAVLRAVAEEPSGLSH